MVDLFAGPERTQRVHLELTINKSCFYCTCSEIDCNNNNNDSNNNNKMCNDLGEGSRCCAAYSIVGAIFTLWVGVMLTTQPFFIGGIEDVGEAQKSAYGAFFMFLFTFVVSAIGMWYDSTFGGGASKQQAADDYVESDYQLAGSGQDYPNYGTSS